MCMQGICAQPPLACARAGDNGVHASASPFEALVERMNWLQVYPLNSAPTTVWLCFQPTVHAAGRTMSVLSITPHAIRCCRYPCRKMHLGRPCSTLACLKLQFTNGKWTRRSRRTCPHTFPRNWTNGAHFGVLAEPLYGYILGQPVYGTSEPRSGLSPCGR